MCGAKIDFTRKTFFFALDSGRGCVRMVIIIRERERFLVNRTKIHVGLRTIKTALAVTLALLAARLFGSAMPIFSAIGAISAMSRTLGDALTACLTQLTGCVIGCTIGCLFLLMFPATPPVVIGLGIVLVILLGLRLHSEFAIPLSCIVFVSICLYDAGSPLFYTAARFADTSVGLIIALAVNMLIKPYNNRRMIADMLTHFVQAFPDYLRERVLLGHYPDLTPLQRSLRRLEEEISLYERQTYPNKRVRHEVGIYLRGCQQLAERMYDEMNALCMMDSPGMPDATHIERLAKLGVEAPDAAVRAPEDRRDEDVVLGYHLDNLLNAFEYLCALNEAPDAEVIRE